MDVRERSGHAGWRIDRLARQLVREELLTLPGSARVRQVAVPSLARTLSALPRVDYEDAFVVQVGAVQERTAEQWARAILEGAPVTTRTALQWGWSVLGLQRNSTAPHSVLGWEMRRGGRDGVLLRADSPLGFVGEVLVKRQRRDLLFATFLQLQNGLARAIWAGVAPGHRQAVRHLLEQVSAREARRYPVSRDPRYR